MLILSCYCYFCYNYYNETIAMAVGDDDAVDDDDDDVTADTNKPCYSCKRCMCQVINVT